ncbi:transcriptional regulator [Mycolicibacterium pulveris]|uniref:Rv0361 family membrane protein n=1 Tax=Mycolicibacterium pulveris TaxID=36813 RepID=UPI003CEEFD02
MVRWLAALTALAALAVASPGPAAAATDQEQVRAVLDGMNDSYNRFDFDAFTTYVCAAMRTEDGFEPGWYSSRRIDGPTHITVGSVSVAGDPPTSAIATVRFEAAHHTETLAVEFVREGAQWKACRYHAVETI